MPTCVCKTGPKGLGSRCSKAAKEGSKFCGIHIKKCLGEFTQTQPFLQQPRMAQPFGTPQPFLQQPRKVQPLKIKLPKVQPLKIKLPPKAQPFQPFKQQPSMVQPSGCVIQTTKKYTDRPSPPFPANKCKGQVMMGKNGKMWASVEKSNGVSAWKEIKQQKA